VYWLKLLILLLIYFTLPSLSLAADPLIKITNYSSNSSPEWVEIQNQSSESVDITGWKIKDANNIDTDDFILSGCLSSLGYLTVIRDSDGWLNNSNETISLLDQQSSLVDQISYTNGKTESSYHQDNTCTFTPTPIPPTQTPTPTLTPTQIPNSPTPTPIPSSTITPTPALSIIINSTPSSVSVNQNFTVSFTANNITPNQEYYFKVFGGQDGDNYGIETQNNSNYYGFTSDWDNFPKFSSTTNSLSQSVTARVKSDKSAGSYHIKIKIRKIDGSFDKESDQKSITVTSLMPTLTPVNTSTPTATVSPTPTPTKEETPTELPTITDQQVLGSTDIKLSPTVTLISKSNKTNNFIPLLLIIIGSLLLLTPIAIAQFKKR